MIYLVLHHEIMGPLDDMRADEMLFYTASTLKKALKLIKESGVDEWSWWEIQTQEIDSPDWPESIGLYDRKGKKIKKAPVKKCEELYRKGRRL